MRALCLFGAQFSLLTNVAVLFAFSLFLPAFPISRRTAYWLAELAATHWLDHIVAILSSAWRVVALLDSSHSVLVHWCVCAWALAST